jgi:hypothetical protein
MKIANIVKAPVWALLCSCCTVVCLALVNTARADSLVLAQSTLISGTESTSDSFTITAPGTVTVELQNLPWPQTLSSLSFMATNGTQVLSDWSTTSSNTQSFAVTPGTYFANISGTTAGALDLGLYSISITFQSGAPVPLPASLWLLASSLLVLVALLWLTGTFKAHGAFARRTAAV